MGRTSGLRAIAFDLFHTLVDPEDFRPREFRRAQAVAEALGLPSTEFERAWVAEQPDRLLRDRPTIRQRLRAHARRLGVELDAAELDRAIERLERYQARAIRNPRPTTVATLRELRARGYRLGVVSNCDASEVRHWSSSPLAPLFDAVVFSCRVGFAKPDPAVFRALVPRWGGLSLSQAAYVGDGSNEELAGARRAGFARVIFQGEFVRSNGLRTAAENERLAADADAEIGSLAELLLERGPLAGPRLRRGGRPSLRRAGAGTAR